MTQDLDQYDDPDGASESQIGVLDQTCANPFNLSDEEFLDDLATATVGLTQKTRDSSVEGSLRCFSQLNNSKFWLRAIRSDIF